MARLNTLGRRFGFDEEGAVNSEESDVDPLSLGGLGIVKPQTRMPAGSYSDYMREDVLRRDTAPTQPVDAKPFDPEVIAMLNEQEQKRLDDAMRQGHSQKPPVILENVGIERGATKTRGPLSLGGLGPLPEPAKAPVPARTADATTGTTISGDVAQKAPAMDDGKAEKPVVAAGAPSVGAGGDEGIDRTALAEALARGGEAIFRGVTGRALPTGIPEMLAAVRQRREAQAQREREIGAERASEALRYEREASLEQAKTERAAANERQANKAYANVLRSMYPEQAKAGLFDSLDDAAGKPQFAAIARAIESSLRGAVERPKIEAQTAEIPLEGASKRAARESRTAVDKARINKIYSDMRLEGARLALDERKVLDAAAKTPDPAKKLEGLNKIADQKDFGGFRTMVSDLQAVEEAAPGFVTQGKVPTWLTPEQMYLAQTVPAMADPKVVKFVSAFSTLKNEDRHRLYGSAQTEGELRSYLQQLNDSPFSAGPQVLAQQVGTLTKKASEKATGRIRRYNQVFGADNVNNVLGGEWQGFYGKGGVLSQAKTPFVGAESAAAPASDRIRVISPDGRPGTIQRSQLEAAKKAGYVEAQ